ncbi:MAG: YraN family protein [Bacteroidaceae bacterium]|nr:YraN family protein [Bacteroidaceae bacterium]
MGIWGENLAVAYLRKKGYIILERDWRSKHRDIDIIAKDKECIVFVEVKTRHINPLVAPIEAVDDKKIKNLCRAINHYIQYKKLDTLWRFDIITIEGNIDSITKPEISHIKDISLFLIH